MVTVKSKMAKLTASFTNSINSLTSFIGIFKFVMVFVLFMAMRVFGILMIVVLLILCMSNVNVGGNLRHDPAYTLVDCT